MLVAEWFYGQVVTADLVSSVTVLNQPVVFVLGMTSVCWCFLLFVGIFFTCKKAQKKTQ